MKAFLAIRNPVANLAYPLQFHKTFYPTFDPRKNLSLYLSTLQYHSLRNVYKGLLRQTLRLLTSCKSFQPGLEVMNHLCRTLGLSGNPSKSVVQLYWSVMCDNRFPLNIQGSVVSLFISIILFLELPLLKISLHATTLKCG